MLKLKFAGKAFIFQLLCKWYRNSLKKLQLLLFTFMRFKRDNNIFMFSYEKPNNGFFHNPNTQSKLGWLWIISRYIPTQIDNYFLVAVWFFNSWLIAHFYSAKQRQWKVLKLLAPRVEYVRMKNYSTR